MLSREEELKIFRKICGKEKVVVSSHTNTVQSNTPRAGFFNQGVSRAKLSEFIEKNNLDFDYWRK